MTQIYFNRAYVVSTRNATLPPSSPERAAYEKEVQEWIKTKVAKHKFLRGGVRVVDVIPKSPSGKILRREVREMAKEEAKAAHAAKLAGKGKKGKKGAKL